HVAERLLTPRHDVRLDRIRRRRPDPDGSVLAACHDALSVRGEGCTEHEAVMASKLCEELRSRDVPDARGLVLAGGDERGAVRAEGDAPDGADVTNQVPRAAGLQIPDADGAVHVPGRHGPSVPAEADGPDVAVVRVDRWSPPRSHIPHVDARPARRCQMRSVGTEGD